MARQLRMIIGYQSLDGFPQLDFALRHEWPLLD
jgi:hypothetical protein